MVAIFQSQYINFCMTKRIPIFHPILHAATLIAEKLREDLAGSGGTSTQGRVLDVIDRLENPVPARVGEALGLTASAMSQMVKRLREAKLIEPQLRTKGRAYSEQLVLSQSGKDFLLRTRQSWHQIEQDLVDLVGEDALTAMFHVSFDIVQGLGANPPFPRELHLADTQADPPESPHPRTTEQSK